VKSYVEQKLEFGSLKIKVVASDERKKLYPEEIHVTKTIKSQR
jgi:hypothetical protein